LVTTLINATTDHSGFYVVTNLPVGTYDVQVEASGFRKAVHSGYDLPDAGSVTADFKLEVGTMNESVTVTAVGGEVVNTLSGEIAHTIDSEQVQLVTVSAPLVSADSLSQ